MSSPDLVTLYNFEPQIEAAANAILLAASIPSYTRLTVPRGDRPLPRVELQFSISGLSGRLHRTDSRKLWPDAFTGQLYAMILTRPDPEQTTEDISADAHGLLRSLVRVTMLEWHAQFSAQLEYLSVNRCGETGPTHSMISEDGIEHTTLLWEMQFTIKDDAWPAN